MATRAGLAPFPRAILVIYGEVSETKRQPGPVSRAHRACKPVATTLIGMRFGSGATGQALILHVLRGEREVPSGGDGSGHGFLPCLRDARYGDIVQGEMEA
jgi:hypothetical protein